MAGQGYTPSLGAAVTVLPSPTSYAAYSLQSGTTTQLQWPQDNFPANSNVCALVNNLTPLGSGCTVQMPIATNTSLGEKGLFFNSGSSAFTLADSSGSTILSVAPGTAWYIALTNNLTSTGTWLVFQFGASVSAANAASLAGPGLAASGALLQQVMTVTTLSSNYTVGTADRDQFFNWTGGAGTLTMALAAAVKNNFYIQVRNSGSGSLTVATQGSDLVNGSSSITLNVNDSCFIVTDGTNWYTIGLGTINTNIFNFQVVSLAGQTGTYVLPSNLQNKVAYRFTGALAGATNIQVPNTIQQYWVDNETTGGFALGIGTSAQIVATQQFGIVNGARFILYCDGTNVLNASTSGLAVPIAINQGGTGATTASAALTNLGGTSIGVNLFQATSAASAQSTLGVLSASDSTAFAIGF